VPWIELAKPRIYVNESVEIDAGLLGICSVRRFDCSAGNQGPSDGASRTRTGDLLGAIQTGRAASKAPETAPSQPFCIRGVDGAVPLDANGYEPICRVSATSGEKWLKSLGPGWTGAWGRSLGAAAPEIVRQRLAGGEHTRRPGSSTRLDAGPHAILARPGGRLGLGAQAGEERLRAVAEEAEFTPVPPSGLPRRPSTLHLEARP